MSPVPRQPAWLRFRVAAVEGISEIGAIWQGELRRAIRSPRTLVLVLLYFVFSAMTLIGVSFMVSAASDAASASLVSQGASEEQLGAAAEQGKVKILGWLFDDDPGLAEALALLPILIPLFFKISLYFIPLYAALMGFDQLSGEIEHRSIRYLAVRARRSSILLGKFAAQATVLLGLILLTDTLAFAVAKLQSPELAFTTLLPSLLKFWVAATVFSLAYVALTSVCSSLFSMPAVSLIFNLLALFGFWLLELVGGYFTLSSEAEALHPAAYLKWISPVTYSDALLHPTLQTFGTGVAAFLAFTAAFLGLGYANLRRRDV